MEGSLSTQDVPTIQAQLDSPTRLIVLGNPGAGKSTLLNGLVGKGVFNAGLSFQGSLTLVSQAIRASNGNVFIDTPGLSDYDTREKAAEEITTALRENATHGNLKLIFVVTFNDGRVRTTDTATIKLVLDALPADTPYGIIVNKIGTRALEKVNTVPKHLEELTVRLNLGRDNKTTYLHFIKHHEELVDAENAIPGNNNGLIEFINSLPNCVINDEDEIEAVRSTETEAIEEKLNILIHEIEGKREEMAREMEIMEQKYEERLSQLRQSYEMRYSEKREEEGTLTSIAKVVHGEALQPEQSVSPLANWSYDHGYPDAAYVGANSMVASRQARDVDVGPIWSNAHAPRVVNSWLAKNPGYEWNGHWVSKNGTSYAGLVPK